MKKKELETLKNKTTSELEEMANKKRDEIMKAKVEFMSGKETNNRRVRNLRHELAQILTIQTIISRSSVIADEDSKEVTKKTNKKS